MSRFFAAALVFALASLTRAEEPSPIQLKKGDRIVFLGDSITQAGNGGKGYIQVIRNVFSEKNLAVDCVGAGISGNKVPDLQRRVDKDVIAKKPTIVIIYIGINDVWHGEGDPKRGTNPEVFEKGLREVIGKCVNAGAKVILCTPTVIGEIPNGGNSLDKKLDEYSGVSRKIAKDLNLTLCDLRNVFTTTLNEKNKDKKASGILTSDRVHLNEAGNRLVAETLLKFLGQ